MSEWFIYGFYIPSKDGAVFVPTVAGEQQGHFRQLIDPVEWKRIIARTVVVETKLLATSRPSLHASLLLAG